MKPGEGASRWEAKQRWHAQQRALKPVEKIRLILQLQQREAQLDRVRAAAGQPTRGLKPWRTHA